MGIDINLIEKLSFKLSRKPGTGVGYPRKFLTDDPLVRFLPRPVVWTAETLTAYPDRSPASAHGPGF